MTRDDDTDLLTIERALEGLRRAPDEAFKARLRTRLEHPPGTPRRTARGTPRHGLIAGTVALAIATTAAALVLGTSTSTPAFAVTENPSGTVTVTIRELVGVTGANAQLARLGVRARVASIQPGCTPAAGLIHVAPEARVLLAIITVEKNRDGVGLTINPRAIPPGDTLLLTARPIAPFKTPGPAFGLTAGLYRGAAPTCST